MIGWALRKMASELGLKVNKGFAYGKYQGYDISLSEGAGTKYLGITAAFPPGFSADDLLALLNLEELNEQYRVLDIMVGTGLIKVVFFDNPGTMKKYRAFFKWFIPFLKKQGISGGKCSVCGMEMGGNGIWVDDGDDTAMHIHSGCMSKVQNMRLKSLTDAEVMRLEQSFVSADIEEEEDGSYGKGFAGAVLGAALGAILWAILLGDGTVACIAGFLMAKLSYRFYGKFHGKSGAGMYLIVFLSCCLGIVFGQLCYEIANFALMIHSGTMYGAAYADIPALIMECYTNPDYVAVFVPEWLLSLLFIAAPMLSRIFETYLDKRPERELTGETKTASRRLKRLE